MEMYQIKAFPNVDYKLSAYYSAILKVWIEFMKITKTEIEHFAFRFPFNKDITMRMLAMINKRKLISPVTRGNSF